MFCILCLMWHHRGERGVAFCVLWLWLVAAGGGGGEWLFEASVLIPNWVMRESQ